MASRAVKGGLKSRRILDHPTLVCDYLPHGFADCHAVPLMVGYELAAALPFSTKCVQYSREKANVGLIVIQVRIPCFTANRGLLAWKVPYSRNEIRHGAALACHRNLLSCFGSDVC